LLGAGYRVRGAVRNAERAAWLVDLFEPYGKENFSLVEVADLTVEGAFDDAVKGKLFQTLLAFESVWTLQRFRLICIL
jgi:hypothetical protein